LDYIESAIGIAAYLQKVYEQQNIFFCYPF